MSPARHRDIPIARRAIVEALSEELEPRLACFAERLAAIYHFEFHAGLEALERWYAPLNPDLDDHAPAERAGDSPFPAGLRALLERGNYRRLTGADIEHAFASRSLFPVNVVVDTSVYRDLVIYARGETVREARIPRLYGLARRSIAVPTFERVCLYIRFKTAAELGLSPAKLAKLPFEPGTSILKLFRNIPTADLEMLFPNCRPTMRALDKLLLGVPALVGGVPVLIKLIPAGVALAVVLGLRSGGVDQQSIIAGLTGLAVLGAYLFRQWDKFKNRRVLFTKVLSENLYFRNLDSNEGVLTRLTNEAEDEECKEALLAYALALTADRPLTIAELDERVEAWLVARFGLEVDFEIVDALAKLEELGLIVREDERLRARPLADAVARLEQRWAAMLSPCA